MNELENVNLTENTIEVKLKISMKLLGRIQAQYKRYKIKISMEEFIIKNIEDAIHDAEKY